MLQISFSSDKDSIHVGSLLNFFSTNKFNQIVIFCEDSKSFKILDESQFCLIVDLYILSGRDVHVPYDSIEPGEYVYFSKLGEKKPDFPLAGFFVSLKDFLRVYPNLVEPKKN